MKTDISHLPEDKQKELKRVVELVNQYFDPNIILIYGSYARGDYVDIKWEYQSDFDMLIVCGQKQKKNVRRVNQLEEAIRNEPGIKTIVHFQYESIGTINAEIAKLNYLFVDIVREGIVLFDTGEVKLAEIRKLEPGEKYEKARKDNEYWMESSRDFTKGYHFFLTETIYNKAAFNLHQRVEHLFMALLLVYTGYKPKTHHLDDLVELGAKIDPELRKCFPKTTQDEKHLYTLLQKAYVDARYDMNYQIKNEELKTLEKWALNLEKKVTKLCSEQLLELKRKVE